MRVTGRAGPGDAGPVTSPRVRALEPDGFRPATDLFRASLHLPPLGDQEWGRRGGRHVPGRTFGSFDDVAGREELVGTAMSFPSRVTVPGGAVLPTAAVSLVGVRADRTRRGHLSALMRVQLDDARARGDVLATLTASETGIYGRFGYGVASRARSVRLRAGAELHGRAPGGGSVRIPAPDRLRDDVVAVYDRLAPSRVGAMARPEGWWRGFLEDPLAPQEFQGVAVHAGPDGLDDGYLVWGTESGAAGEGDRLRVLDLQAEGAGAATDLWRYLLHVDLAGDITARRRPLDEDLSLLLTDPRRFRVEDVADEVWMRLLDVPAALAARGWGEAAPVLLRVHDRLLPQNDGLLRIDPSDPKPVEDGGVAPELECDADALAMAYLGDRRPSELVDAGWWTAHDGAAVERADALFATPAPPWCGTFF